MKLPRRQFLHLAAGAAALPVVAVRTAGRNSLKGDALLLGASLAPQRSPVVFLRVPRKAIFIMRIAASADL
jgi:hypothetical protein